MKRLEPSDCFIATVQELKEMLYIDEEDELFGSDVCCIICGKWYMEKELWLVLKDAGSGSMDDYICSDCIERVHRMMCGEHERRHTKNNR